MRAPILTLFNNKGGVGKTSLVYHLAWTYARLGKRVVVVDLDPQANLTAAFLDEDTIEKIWSAESSGSTVYQCLEPLTEISDVSEPSLQTIASNLYLLPGDVALSSFEDTLSQEWPKSLDDGNLFRSMLILSSPWQLMRGAAEVVEADLVLVDIGPNLGAINRSALLATDFVAIPLGADLFSLQGLKNLGPTLQNWKKGWRRRIDNWRDNTSAKKQGKLQLPQGNMAPIGYLCQQYGIRLDRPVKAYDKWVQRIPQVYRESVLGEQPTTDSIQYEDDPYRLATIKHYRSLVPMAQEQRKPIFNLTSADGAVGAHASAAQDAGKDFIALAKKIAEKIKLII